MTISINMNLNSDDVIDSSETETKAKNKNASASQNETPIVNLGEILDVDDEAFPEPKYPHPHLHPQQNGFSHNDLKRTASLTDLEAYVLKALLIDRSGDEEDVTAVSERALMFHKETDEELRIKLLTPARAKLNDEMLFSVPPQIIDDCDHVTLSSANINTNQVKTIPIPKRKSNHALWLAHWDGVHPKTLASLATRIFRKDPHSSQSEPESKKNRIKSSITKYPDRKSPARRRVKSSGSAGAASRNSTNNDENYDNGDDEDDIPSDDEVRPELDSCKPAEDDSSWESQRDAHHREYDAWEVLKDEYAVDFGFDFTQPGSHHADTDDDVPTDSFQIIGTSPDDPECHPHVMSPPMLDALMSFLPENLMGQNFWLRFSLVRDGASLNTLKRYVRASQYTILAIETPSGQVFGSFTSSPWRNTYGFYGSTPAFVWKMRRSRQTACASLFEQAQLESEIAVFMADGNQDKIQVCRHDTLAVGGDENMQSTDDEATSTSDDDENRSSSSSSDIASESGFAIALEDDLLRGTTSHCRTFHNPALCGDGRKTQVFDVAGLEVWTLTPCFDVKAAEKLEMTKFFMDEQSTRSLRSLPDSPTMGSRRNSSLSASEAFNQEQFYRRIGHDPESESRRDRWQYLNTMDGFVSDRRAPGASPRFGFG